MSTLGNVIASFQQGVTLKRKASAGAMVNGRLNPASFVTSSIQAGVTPAGEKELARLPEGMRARGVIRLFTEVELKPAPTPDEIVWLGAEYEVQNAAPWTSPLGVFWDSLAVRKVGQS